MGVARPVWLQNVTNYTADEFRTLLDAAFAAPGVIRAGLAVTPTGPVSMGVYVAPGFALVAAKSAANGKYLVEVTSQENPTTAVGGAQARIDTVVCEVDDTAFADPSDTAVIKIVQGTPSGSPVQPTLTNNQLPLANIAVAISQSTIAAGNITDRRPAADGPATAYSPTWTNLTVGNGTVTANYLAVGKYLFLTVQIVFGSTTSISGAVSVSIPAGYLAGADQSIPCRISAQPAAAQYWGAADIPVGGTTLAPYLPQATADVRMARLGSFGLTMNVGSFVRLNGAIQIQ